MSAFVVDEGHIDVLVTAAYDKSRHSQPLRFGFSDDGWCEFGRGTTTGIEQRSNQTVFTFSPDALGAMLLMENHASVSYRYQEEAAPDTYTFHHYEASAVQVFKAISCFEYQSCEHPAWEHSTAHAFCSALRKLTIEHLPGYSDAEWEVSRAVAAA